MSFAEEKQISTFFLIVSIVVLSIVWLFQAPTAWELRFNWWSVPALVIGILSVMGLVIDTAWEYLAAVSVSAGVFFGVYLLPFWVQVCLMAIGVSIALASFIYYGLAEWNAWYTKFEREGRVKLVMKAGQYAKTLFLWDGHTLDDEGNVVPVGKFTENGKVIDKFKEIKDDMPVEAKHFAEMERFTFTKARKIKERIEAQSIKTFKELEKAAREERLVTDVKGIGEITQDKIVRMIESKNGTYYKPSKKTVNKNGEEVDSPSDADKVITTYEEIVNPASNDEVVRQENGDLHRWGGIRFFSSYYPLYEVNSYEFSWASVTQNGEIKLHENEELDYILIRPDLYYFQVTEAEDADLLPLGAELVVRIRVVNPKKAMLVPQNWLEMTVNLIRPAVRNSLSSERYKRLTEQPGDLSDDIFATITADGLIDELEEEYGVRVEKLEIMNLDPPEDLREATLKEAVAGYEADAERTRAEGEADAKKIRYQAIKDFEPLSLNVEGIEAVKESNPYIIGDNLKGLVKAINTFKN